jgi:hypothetical protein
MLIPTSQSLRRQNRRVDRRLASAERVLAAMRAGSALHLQFCNGTPRWSLSDGRPVDPTVARVVVTNTQHIVPVGTALFAGTHPQTYRWAG